MSGISWIGVILLFVKKDLLDMLKKPLIAFSAGSLLGGAFLHMIPEALHGSTNSINLFTWVTIGFLGFLFLEQCLNWRHRRHHELEHGNNLGGEPNRNQGNEMVTSTPVLILIADGIHNFIGGIAIATSFLISIEVGTITWIAAAAHEIPQELGDFGILIHGGWKRKKALLANFLSALTILPGSLLVFIIQDAINVPFLICFAAGNFIYLSASDLIPELTHPPHHDFSGTMKSLLRRILDFLVFTGGLMLIIITRYLFQL